MSGSSWVGMSSVPKPTAGETVSESRTFNSYCSDVETLVQLTTEAGLSSWLDRVETFDIRRGGDIVFEAGYRGSYSMLDIPKHIVLQTERHGEISIRVQTKAKPIVIEMTITRFVPAGEDVEEMRSLLRATIDALVERLRV